MQSRFFHSSLKEIELNIKEIYSLQSELRERVLASTNKPAKIIPIQPTSFQGLGTYESSSASTEPSAKNDVSDITNNEMAGHSAELPKQQFIWSKEKFDQDNLHQTSSNTSTSDSKFNTELNKINTGAKSAEETSKEHKKINRTLSIVLIFLIWEVSALLIFVLFIL
jgi:hypothetical protein